MESLIFLSGEAFHRFGVIFKSFRASDEAKSYHRFITVDFMNR